MSVGELVVLGVLGWLGLECYDRVYNGKNEKLKAENEYEKNSYEGKNKKFRKAEEKDCLLKLAQLQKVKASSRNPQEAGCDAKCEQQATFYRTFLKQEQDERTELHEDRAGNKLNSGALYEWYWWRFGEGQARRQEIDREFESMSELRAMWQRSETQKSL